MKPTTIQKIKEFLADIRISNGAHRDSLKAQLCAFLDGAIREHPEKDCPHHKDTSQIYIPKSQVLMLIEEMKNRKYEDLEYVQNPAHTVLSDLSDKIKEL